MSKYRKVIRETESQMLDRVRAGLSKEQNVLRIVGPLYPARVKGRSKRGWTSK